MSASLLDDEEAPSPSEFSFACAVVGGVYPRQSRQCKVKLLSVPALQKTMDLCGLMCTDQSFFKLNYEWLSLCLLGLQFK